ncbi:CLUMA_CG000647, isoform A [Clunio marinus]|uniref:CLUMA_CG000647, isoform A n=1 Tax=Clunio marinus TaxID=568069 RepID=A0A1J1HGY7_9DIPT|nr:CLUMA_CG000647, isoform A [Clunio marinus]
MKVLAIVFFVAVAAVCAVPVDETNKQDNVDTVVVLEDDSSLDVADIDGGLVREKRQFGGYGGYGGRGGYGGYGRGGYGGYGGYGRGGYGGYGRGGYGGYGGYGRGGYGGYGFGR